MAYIATQSLLWGEDTIPPGGLVPSDEPGRDYAGMIQLGQIRVVDDTAGLSDEAVLAELNTVKAERDQLKARVAELEADEGEESPPVEIPDGVVPGETPGWPLVVLSLTDEQRDLLAEAGVSGTLTVDELSAKFAELRDDDKDPADDSGGQSEADGDDLPDGVVETSPGWFQVPGSDRSVRRKDIAAALAEAKEK